MKKEKMKKEDKQFVCLQVVIISLLTIICIYLFLENKYLTKKSFLNISSTSKPVNTPTAIFTPAPTTTPEDFKNAIFKLVNEERIKNGLKPLKENAKLDESANLKLNDLINNRYWDHVSPEGIDPWYFFKKVGYVYEYAGENLAKDFYDPISIVEAWMVSKEHKENILNQNFTETGIAVGYSPSIVVVQHFATPQIPRPQIPSRTGKIISYHEWCTGKDILVYENELITRKSADGNTYSMTQGDWDCYENSLKNKK